MKVGKYTNQRALMVKVDYFPPIRTWGSVRTLEQQPQKILIPFLQKNNRIKGAELISLPP